MFLFKLEEVVNVPSTYAWLHSSDSINLHLLLYKL